MKNKRIFRFVTVFMLLLVLFSTSASAAKVKLNKTKLTMNVGQSYTLKLLNNSKNVIWKSSNYPKATVSTSGRVVARKKGTVKITAIVGNKKYNCKITIKQPVQKIEKITLDKSELSLVVGKSYTLKAGFTPSNVTNKTLKWKSSNSSVATVTATGKVTGFKNGTATITATTTDGSKKSVSCIVTVRNITTGDTTVTNGVQSSNARKYLAGLKRMSDQVRADKANGKKWTYGKPTNKKSFREEEAYVQAGGVGHTDCAIMVSWGLVEAGIFPSGANLHANYSGIFEFNKILRNVPNFANYFEIITVNKTPNQLLKEGNLLPGDICGWGGMRHTNVYAGNGKWYDAGRGANVTYTNGEHVFNSFGPSSGWMNSKIVQILRLK